MSQTRLLMRPQNIIQTQTNFIFILPNGTHSWFEIRFYHTNKFQEKEEIVRHSFLG